MNILPNGTRIRADEMFAGWLGTIIGHTFVTEQERRVYLPEAVGDYLEYHVRFDDYDTYCDDDGLDFHSWNERRFTVISEPLDMFAEVRDEQ